MGNAGFISSAEGFEVLVACKLAPTKLHPALASEFMSRRALVTATSLFMEDEVTGNRYYNPPIASRPHKPHAKHSKLR